VRTKNVTYESVPTLEHVKGLAVFGPGATLFTLGRNNTAQQFDLNSPPVLVANVQHPANPLPPSPPVSIEEKKQQDAPAPPDSADLSSVPINVDISESDEDHMSPLARIAREMDKHENESSGAPTDRADTLSPVSSRSQASSNSINSRSSGGSQQYRHRSKHTSVASRVLSDGTTMSLGSSLHSHSIRDPSLVSSSRDSLSMSSLSSTSNASFRRQRGSRLRQEVLQSPEDAKIIDLFKFTKSRLSDIPYRHPQVLDNTLLTNDNLRRQMLSTIFGWDGDVEALIQDELNRHPAGSPNRLLLAKWLGDIDTDIMSASSESMTSSDWMLLALSGIGGHASQAKVARAYVQRLLEKGDVHTAATIMIGMGDQNDAIEIYVSHKRYMEALILTSLVFPADWQRQAELVRKWGEWAVQHGQQQLAIRCFSCTGSESSEPWFSPGAQAATFSKLQQNQGIPEILSPPLSPPGSRGPQRSIAKTSALKLITSFGDKSSKSKFFRANEDERTPIGGGGILSGGGITPIAESAISPSGDTAHTALLRPGHRSAYATPISARTATPGGFTRQRLPSIGETPSDVIIPGRKIEPAKKREPSESAPEKRSVGTHERKSSQPTEIMQLSPATYNPPPTSRAATASPMMQKTKGNTAALPSPSPESLTNIQASGRVRNGSRDRKPDGLQIQWPPMESILTGDYMTSPDQSVTSSKYRAQRSAAASVTSTSSTGRRSPLLSERSYRSLGNHSPAVTGKSLDQYISSLESAQHYAEKKRARQRSRESRDKSGRARSSSRKTAERDPSEDRGRSIARYVKPAKRSPTSPLPMSPEDLRGLGAVGYGDDNADPNSKRDTSKSRASKPSSRIRRSSADGLSRVQTSSKPTSRVTSRNNSRRAGSREPLNLLDSRGRSKSRGDGSTIRSPSSPLPMSPQAKLYQDDEDGDEDLQRAVRDQMRFRSQHRSTSRTKERGTSSTRGGSPETKRRDRSNNRKLVERSGSKPSKEPEPHPKRPTHSRRASEAEVGDINKIKDERTLKKEQAARELEERRKSLARRPSAPPIVHPEELARLSPMSYQPITRTDYSRASIVPAQKSPSISRSQTTSPANIVQTQESSSSTVQVGLPATPRAMRHPKFDPDGKDIPDVPQIPERYDNSQPSSWSLNNHTLSYNNAFENLAPLPKSVYQSPPRRVPPRSASAPILEEPASPPALPAALPLHPAFQAALPPSTRRRPDSNYQRTSQLHLSRKISPGESQPGTLGYEVRNSTAAVVHPMSGIEETLEASTPVYNSNENLTPPPPPPPPAPPILKELQHLAKPPPPPPAPIAPLYHQSDPNTHSIVSGISSQGSQVIEIVMDDEEDPASGTSAGSPKGPAQALPQATPQATPQAAPQVPPPAPPQAPYSHHRGRSETDNSITGRISRAAERLRSASRGRNTVSPVVDRTKSPQDQSPYDSMPWPTTRSAAASPSTSVPNLGLGNLPERHPAVMTPEQGGMI
jgi:hypothetical protein